MDLKKINQIYFHDAELYNYMNDGRNITFLLKDGWEYNTYYKFELKNVMVQVMNSKPEYIKFILDRFNNLDIDDNINLFSGEIGLLDKQVNNCKYYLKLWIRYPWNIDYNYLDKEYKLGEMDVSLCDDYDDTGNLYIKFIVEDINIIDLYPLLKKYSRHSKENIENLYKYKDRFDEKTFKFFSVFDTGFYIYDDYQYEDNNLCITCKQMLDINNTISIKFLDISDRIDIDDLNKFIENMLNNNFEYYECIRIIKCIDDKYVVGLLKSLNDEIVFSCNEIVYDGELLNIKSILD